MSFNGMEWEPIPPRQSIDSTIMSRGTMLPFSPRPQSSLSSQVAAPSTADDLIKYYSLFHTAKRDVKRLSGANKKRKEDEIEAYTEIIDRKINEIESFTLARVLAELKESIPTSLLDMKKLKKESQNRFYDPSYFIFLKRFMNNIIHRDEGIDNSIRINYWMDHLNTIASGGFGKVLSAGITRISDIFAMKVPLAPVVDLRHEFLVGMAINELRERSLTPNFVYTYNFFTCTPPKYEGEKVVGFCASSANENTEYVLLENVSSIGSLEDLLLYRRLTVRQFMSIFLQAAFSLHVGNVEIDLNHWDLHPGNNMIREDPQKRYVTYNIDGEQITFSTEGYIDIIIDFGRSSYRTTDSDGEPIIIGPRTDLIPGTSNYFTGTLFPLADIYRLLMSSYTLLVLNVLTRRHSEEKERLVRLLELMIGPLFKDSRKEDQKDMMQRIIQLKNKIISHNDKKDRDALHALSFQSLDPYYAKFSIKDYLDIVLPQINRQDLPSFKFFSENERETQISRWALVSCLPKGRCLSGGLLEWTYFQSPQNYPDLDQINMDISTFNDDERGILADNTLALLQEEINKLEISADIIHKNFIYRRQEVSPNISQAIIENFNEFMNEAIELWHTVSEIVFIKYLTSKFDLQMNDRVEHIDLVDELKRVPYLSYSDMLEEVSNKIKKVEANFLGSNNPNFLANLQAARLLLSFDVAKIGESIILPVPIPPSPPSVNGPNDNNDDGGGGGAIAKSTSESDEDYKPDNDNDSDERSLLSSDSSDEEKYYDEDAYY